MPRLGHDAGGRGSSGRPGGGGGGGDRPAAAAYPHRARSPVLNTLFLLGFIFVLRNIFFKDYRNEEIGYLRSAGKSDEEIERYVHGVSSSKTRNARVQEYTKMKRDIEVLKAEVQNLRAKVLGEEAAKELPVGFDTIMKKESSEKAKPGTSNTTSSLKATASAKEESVDNEGGGKSEKESLEKE